jgi:hypothetical protein
VIHWPEIRGHLILRVLSTVTNAQNIRGEVILPKRSPELNRRFRDKEAKESTDKKQDLHELFSQFIGFMSKAIDQYGDSGTEKVKSEALPRFYTPTSDGADIPAIKAQPQTYKPEITKGKVYFNCPACLYPTALFADSAGKKTRCPRCYSAIIAPHPGKKIPGQNLQYDLETMINPEEFTTVIPRKSSFATVLPIPKITTTLSAVAGIVFFAATIGAARLAVHKFSPNSPTTVTSVEYATSSQPETSSVVLQSRAEALVERFVTETDWYSRSRLVRDRNRVAPLMKEYYGQNHPNDVPGQYERKIKAIASGFYQHLNSSVQYTKVAVEVPAAKMPPSIFVVEHTAMGDYIEWESSVAYNPLPLSEMLAKRAGKVQSLRVIGRQDDYFNYEYDDGKEFICVRVQFADEPESTAYAYLPANDIQAPKLLSHLRGANRDNMKPLTLEVRLSENSGLSRQMEIVSVGENHWRWEGGINPAFIADGIMSPSPAD